MIVYVLREHVSGRNGQYGYSYYNLIGIFTRYRAAVKERARRLGKKNAHLATYWPIDPWEVQ